jgi:hypothetical protein
VLFQFRHQMFLEDEEFFWFSHANLQVPQLVKLQ